MAGWFDLGCDECRQGILAGNSHMPLPVATSIEAHAHLRRCPSCGSWWIENEREAHVIAEDEARATFPDHFR
jgi:hypothetical protein